MRRMISAWVAVIAVLCLTGTAFAAKKWTGSVEGGMALPSGDYGSSDKADASAGWNLGGTVDYQYRDDLAFGLDGSLGQNKGGLQGTTTDLGGGDTQTLDKDQYNTWNFGVHARYFFPMASSMPVKWYGLVGGSLYGFNQNSTVTSVIGGVSSSADYKLTDKRAGMKFGLGGVYWTSPKLGFNAGLDYNVAFLDKDQSPYSSMAYMGAHVGVTFDIPSSTDQP
jgi:hypothetical protein